MPKPRREAPGCWKLGSAMLVGEGHRGSKLWGPWTSLLMAVEGERQPAGHGWLLAGRGLHLRVQLPTCLRPSLCRKPCSKHSKCIVSWARVLFQSYREENRSIMSKSN